MRKSLPITLLSLILASPVPAAQLGPHGHGVKAGAFAGVRFRMGLDHKSVERPRFGLTVAPTFAVSSNAGIRHGFGEGIQLGFVGDRPLASIAGMSLTSSGEAVGPDRLGLSRLGTGVIILGGAALIGGAILALQVAEGNRNSD